MTKKPSDYKVIFCGTPEVSTYALQALLKAGYFVPLVLTTPDKPQGRVREIKPSPVKQYALDQKIPVYQPAKLTTTEALEKIQAIKADMAVVAAYGKLIPNELLNALPYGWLNIHPSLLPFYRGPSPVQSALLNGEKVTGVSIMLLDEEMDHGPILTQRQILIEPTDYASNLTEKLFKIGAKLLIEILPHYLEGKIKPYPQDHSRASYCSKIDKNSAEIDWQRPAQEILNQIRAFDIWPVAWTKINLNQFPWSKFKLADNLLKIYRARISSDPILTPGFFQLNKKERKFLIGTATEPLEILELQFSGKKRMRSTEFLHGLPL